MSEIGKLDAKPETKKRLKYGLNLKNEDGLDSKWQHAGKKGGNTLVDDGSGKGTKVRACVKAGKTKSKRPRMAKRMANCITCKMVPRKQFSDKCSPCQLAIFFST